jgi:hypothetical protein
MRAAEAVASGALGAGMRSPGHGGASTTSGRLAQALARYPGDGPVCFEFDRDAHESHQHDSVGPQEECVLDGVEKAPLRVGEPVLTVEARSAVKADDGGDAACELLAVALRHAERRHNGIGPAIYGGFDHGPRVLQPLDSAVGARVVHGYDQRPAVGSQYRYVPHFHLWDSFCRKGTPL